MRAAALAAQLGAPLEGPDGELSGAAPLETASESELCFVAGEKSFAPGAASGSRCVIAPPNYQPPPWQAVIRSDQPRALFAKALTMLYPPRPLTGGIHPTAQISGEASIDAASEIGPLCSIGAHSRIGPNTRLSAGCHLGANVAIGADSLLHAGVIVYDNVRIGNRVVIHSGAIIGADGFGFAPQQGAWIKFPQVGSVEIEDDVEIGANSCIDRAALGRTRIGAGTKLDNMVHVGHNCDIGRNVVVAAQTGFSGGVVIGDGAIVGGQVGVGDKVRIEPGVVLGSGSGVFTSKIVRAGQPLWGTPARPVREHLEQMALVARLPQMRNALRAILRRVELLEEPISPSKDKQP